MSEIKVLRISKGWLQPMMNGIKRFDIRKGRRGFEVGEEVKFCENETGDNFNAIIDIVVNSWEAPEEWKWQYLGDFVAIGFTSIGELKE